MRDGSGKGSQWMEEDIVNGLSDDMKDCLVSS